MESSGSFRQPYTSIYIRAGENIMINLYKRFSKISDKGGKIHIYDRVEQNRLCNKNKSNHYGLRVRTYTKDEMLKELQKPYWYCIRCMKLLKTRKYKNQKVKLPNQSCESCKFHDYNYELQEVECLLNHSIDNCDKYEKEIV